MTRPMTVPMIRTTTLALLAAGLFAVPASASTQDNLRDCKAQLVQDGHVTDSDRVRFEGTKRSTVMLSVETEAGTERTIACKVKRGKVVAMEEDGTVLAARAASATTGN